MASYVGKMWRARSHISAGGIHPGAIALERNKATLGELDDEPVYDPAIPLTDGLP